MIHTRLTDFQIHEAFGDALSLIYKKKVKEINDELQPVYNHLDSLQIPQISEFTRWFAKQCAMVDPRVRMLFKSIDHINKIRRMKPMAADTEQQLNIEKAKSVPIETLFDFIKRGKNVSCPFHVDKHPSASIKYNRLVCFQCGFKGDTIALFMKMNNKTFRESVLELCK